MTVIDAVVVAVCVAVAVAIVGGGLIGILRWMLRLILAEGLEKLDERIETHIKPLADDIAAVKAELSFNGGSTVKDQVKRLADNILNPESES